MKKKSYINYITFILMAVLIFYGVFVLKGEEYYLVSLGVIILGLVGFLFSFEGKKPTAMYLVCVVAFCALAVGSRMVFAVFPQVKPIAAVVILAGIAMGKSAGFMVGMLSMFVSNFYFMQGPWTPFQMFAMGLVGFFAGVIFFVGKSDKDAVKESFYSKKYLHENTDPAMTQKKNTMQQTSDVSDFLKDDPVESPGRAANSVTLVTSVLVAIYGFLSVLIIYGGIVDINTVYFSVGDSPAFEAVAAVYIAGLPFNLIFAGTTAVFLFVFCRPVLKRFKRVMGKYEI